MEQPLHLSATHLQLKVIVGRLYWSTVSNNDAL